MEQLQFKHVQSPPFELSLVTRNANDEPTGRKNFISDNGYKLSQFYLRHKGKPKKKSTTSDKPKTTDKVVKLHNSIQAYVDTTERETQEDGKK